MSHLAKIATQIRSLEVARMAAEHLGIGVVENATGVRTFYAQEKGGGGRSTPVDLVLGYSAWSFNLGLQRQDDGTYTLVGDNYDLLHQGNVTERGVDAQGNPFNRTTLSGRQFLALFGPDMHKYETRPHPVTRVEGHFMSGTPTRFLMEYALQGAAYIAQFNGMLVERVPCDHDLDDALPGAEKLKITGGYLPKHLTIHVIGNPDGSSRIWVEGASNNLCYEYTRPFEDALGAIITDQPITTDTCHVVHAGQVQHIGRK